MISYPYQVSGLISQDIRTGDTASDWLIANLSTIMITIENDMDEVFRVSGVRYRSSISSHRSVYVLLLKDGTHMTPVECF